MYCGIPMVFVVMVMVVVASIFVLCTDGPKEKVLKGRLKQTRAPRNDSVGKKSCVQSIAVNTFQRRSEYQVKINLANESRCFTGRKKWSGKILECDQNNKLGRFTFKKAEGYLCPKAKCQKLKIGDIYSPRVETPHKILNVYVAFSVFDTSGLQLMIKSDRRVQSWNLTILDCQDKPKCYEKKVITYAGNHSVLSIEENFLPDMCYGFILDPNGFDNCIFWLQTKVIMHPSGCHPQESKLHNTSNLVKVRGQSWWLMPLGVMLVTAFLISIKLIISGVWKHGSNSALSRGRERNSRSAPAMAAKHRQAVFILYARESEAHVAKVTQLMAGLRKDLCQVFDVFDNSNLEKVSNPSSWLQEMISTSSLKIMLVVSCQVLDYFHALVNLQSNADASDGWFNADYNNKLLLAGMKHLLDRHLVRNYNRVFVVSFGKVEVGCTLGQLVVESRCYILPQHWDVLLADVMENKDYSTFPYCRALGMDSLRC